MEKPDVSLIVCTRNRAAQLKPCLDYVAQMRPACSWEFIVVDNGSTDGTVALLRDFAAKASFPVTIISEPKPGLGRAHNAAWKPAKGDIVAFTDDDCYVAPNHIDRIKAPFADPRIGFVGGRVDLFDPDDHPISIRAGDKEELLAPYSFVEPGWIIGANMAFRRKLLEEIGGFDSDLGPGTRFRGGEDNDVLARASFAGWYGLYTPDAVVAHHHRRKMKDVPELLRNYALGEGAYMAKFLLRSDTRATYLRAWYWKSRRVFMKGNSAKMFFLEIRTALYYIVYRLYRGAGGNRFMSPGRTSA